MKIHKFEGATIRDAIAKVKAKLGDQAVIISTRQIRQGLLGTATEISAAIDDDAPVRTGPTTGGPAPALRPRPNQAAGTKPDKTTGAANDKTSQVQVPTQAPNQTAKPPSHNVERLIEPLRTELRSLRAMVRTSGEGRNTELRSEVAALRQLVLDMRRDHHEPRGRDHDDGVRRPRPTKRRAGDVHKSHGIDDTPLVRASTGRAIMLVGPTGAGKTTTIAKLAARAALIDGKRVKLVTLDNYRVGGVDQIQTFADLIGVPLNVAETPSSLAEFLDDDYDLVLIDTAGRSPRDTASIDELAAELATLPPIEIHLVVPASAGPEAIDELAARYSRLAPSRLLFTKLDEVERCPELTNAPSRTGLPITWVTMGQGVPEDIEEPTSARVLELSSGYPPSGRSTIPGLSPFYWQSRQVFSRTRNERAA